ncbi:LppX_LprAFG lipoprotein [Nocardioides islandensis]|uniref:LppX_LprAFG lipoprotein n=1 Tax=Nocardioides islandensis TaxID=433663 RepID=A0A930VDI9_9ACTN|nr:LppX_LprAFG lipoprotein [Nocardioides islandensis]MBF4765499.1 LppX_LprAFG lipoprotein [Nocardioides islandensis]
MKTRVVRWSGVALAVWAVAGCSSQPATEGRSVDEVLTAAKDNFDEAASVHLTLATSSTPSGGNGVLGADGTLTHQPAFKGMVRVLLGGFNAEVPVISVDGEVHAKLPLTTSYQVIDPAEYGAPDPADFADPDSGISGLLVKLEDPSRGAAIRQGDQVLTTFTGTLLGTYVDPIIPSADAKGVYDTEIGISEDDQITTLRVTGEFFSGGGDETYDMTFDAYGEAVTVTAP